MPPISTPTDSADTEGPNASLPFGQAGSMQQLSRGAGLLALGGHQQQGGAEAQAPGPPQQPGAAPGSPQAPQHSMQSGPRSQPDPSSVVGPNGQIDLSKAFRPAQNNQQKLSWREELAAYANHPNAGPWLKQMAAMANHGQPKRPVRGS